jgi:acyl-CoA thioester hydrolase
VVTTNTSGQVPADAGEADAVASLLGRLAGQRARLLDVVGTLSEEELDRTPEPGGWTARQQLAHLAEMEGIWLSWALSIAYSPECQVGLRGQSPTPSIHQAHTRSGPELLDSLEEARDRTIEAVAALTPRQLARRGYHRWFGPLTTLQCLRAIYRHDRMHTEQILEQPSSIRMPDLPDPAEAGGWFTITRRVAWADTDTSRAWAFTVAQRYAEEAEVAFLTDADVLELLYPHLPRIYVEAKYVTPAYFNQEVDVDLALTRLGSSSLHLVFRILRGATLCAAGRVGAAYVGHDGRAAQLPGEVRAALSPRLRPEKDKPWD